VSVTVPPWGNADQFLPRGVAQDFIGAIEEASMALALGRTMRMSEATESIPIVAFRPQAKFVTPAYGGRKPATEIRWTAVEIRAEEVAATIPVPNAWIMDAGFDVEGQVERELANAMAWAIDQAILEGIGAPASFPTGGVLAFADAVTGPDAMDTISEAFENLEAKGIMPDGVAAGASIGSALRGAYQEARALPGVAPANSLWGVPVRRSLAWEPPPDAIVGGWQYLAIGIREDVTFGRSNDGVLLNDAGAIIASAFQDNVTLVKVYARIGCAIGMPARAKPGAIEPQKPFAKATWSGGAEAASAQSAEHRRGPGRPPKSAE
jgi:Phage capsid family